MTNTTNAQIGISHATPRVWHVVDVRLQLENEDSGGVAIAQEAIEYALMEAGALGTEINALQTPPLSNVNRPTELAPENYVENYKDAAGLISGYFADAPDDERLREKIKEAMRIYNVRDAVLRSVEQREIVNRDWLVEWKANWHPVIAEPFIIAPSWSDVEALMHDENRYLIRIEPGMAFGTGTHETTRLCLEVIGRYARQIKPDFNSFLDVGCGTGILAIAAAKINPNAHIEACDTDAEAVKIAIENARLNNVAQHINFQVGSATDETASADFVCANLTADVITPLLPTLVKLTCGRLVLSGILVEQTATIEIRLKELGVLRSEILQSGEWVAFIV